MISIAGLGGTRYAAVAKLSLAIRARTWADDDQLVSLLVTEIERHGGVARIEQLASLAPPSFLARNRIGRREVTEMLRSLAT